VIGSTADEQTARFAGWLAYWQISTRVHPRPPDPLAAAWLQLVGPRSIPINMEQRRDELRDTYRELEREVKRWRTFNKNEKRRRGARLTAKRT
jgi:hypothetical protein